MVRIFAYGSNLFVSRMVGRVPSARVLACARLEGHALRFHKRSKDGSGKANVIAAGGEACVWGVVYEIAREELAVLDRCEGGYERRAMEVELVNEGRVVADVYVAKSGYVEPAMRPFGWYKRLVVDGARMHGLPEEYVAVIERVLTCD